jgi:hypothetical protein
VRAVEVIAASVTVPFPFVKTLSLGNERRNQRRRFPEFRIRVRIRLELPHLQGNGVQPYCIGIEQRSAELRRQSITHQANEIDIGWAQCNLLIDNASRLISQCAPGVPQFLHLWFFLEQCQAIAGAFESFHPRAP